MKQNTGYAWLIPVWALVIFVTGLFVTGACSAYSRSDYQQFQNAIIDHRNRLNKKFKKIRRTETRYIIVHTSELGLSTTLRVVSKGKQFKSGHRTPGGHAHYVIARSGHTYRIMDKQYRADHAGLSMWQGKQDVSSVSIGIELVGYHSAPLTEQQYRSAAMLIDILQSVYHLDDTAVLTHSQIAFGRPNPWFPKDHRGRKRCAKNFDRSRAGLGPTLDFDPDVRTERLLPDPYLAKLFYGKQPAVAKVAATAPVSNLISKNNSAWSIAGEDYDSRTTAYVLPNGRILAGNQIKDTIGWHLLPVNTKVLLDQKIEKDHIQISQTPVKVITDRMTAWSHAGPAYRFDSTIYFLPSGMIYSGSRIPDWDDLPQKTQLIIGYQGPFLITDAMTAYGIAGQKYKDPDTVYFLPPGHVKTGNTITDFSNLPEGTRVYLPLDDIG